MAVFWVVAACGLVGVFQFFSGACCPHPPRARPNPTLPGATIQKIAIFEAKLVNYREQFLFHHFDSLELRMLVRPPVQFAKSME
jgi:hypothetical protein